MTVRVWEHVPSVLEVGCSGATLDPGTEVFYVTLDHFPSRDRIASVSVQKKACTTFTSFSACRIDDTNNRLSELRTLVMNMSEGEIRSFKCVVSYGHAGYARNAEWVLDVRMNGEL
jgi:hypothetical protein